MILPEPLVTPEDVIQELTQVVDPEIGIDIVNLGLVYEVAVHLDCIHVWMTFTTPHCPVGPAIEQEVRRALSALPLIRQVEVHVVWDPPWDWTMMSDAAKAALGIGE